MKKKLTALILASALTLVGCGSEESSSSQTAEETAKATVTTTEMVYVELDEVVKFDDYDELMAQYNKGRSSNYVYPLPDIVNTWEFTSASLCPSNYTLHYTDTTNQVNIMLEIGFNSTYEKISDYFNKTSYSDGAFEIPEITDRYAVKHYTEFDSYAIIGITGEENIRYTLVVSSKDETKDPVELLKEYKEILEL